MPRLRDVSSAVELSARVGLPQTEVMALESLAFGLIFRGEFGSAEPIFERAMAAARRADARRYVATDLMLMTSCRRAQGRPAEARELVAEAFELSRQSAGFLGPPIFAAKAMLRGPGREAASAAGGRVDAARKLPVASGRPSPCAIKFARTAPRRRTVASSFLGSL